MRSDIVSFRIFYWGFRGSQVCGPQKCGPQDCEPIFGYFTTGNVLRQTAVLWLVQGLSSCPLVG